MGNTPCVARGGDCWDRRTVKFVEDNRAEDEREQELEAAAERDRVLDALEDDDGGRRFERFYSVAEFDEITHFKSEFLDSKIDRQESYGEINDTSRKHTLVELGLGPWGIAAQKGGSDNTFMDIDGTQYKCRGPNYLSDRKKIMSASVLAELVVFDIFNSDVDIPHVSVSRAANTIQRLRREGEDRTLLVLNLRLVPLHCVAVWRMPDIPDSCPAHKLFSSFVKGPMTDEDRKKRLKVIPKIVEGPWVARKTVGENQPAILGRNIPIQFYQSESELEVSVGIGESSVARRVVKVLQPAARSLDIELALVIEGLAVDELPEQICCGFRLRFPNLGF